MMSNLTNQQIQNILQSYRDKAKDLTHNEELANQVMKEYLTLHNLELKPYNDNVDEFEYDGKKITEDDPEIVIHNVNHYRVASSQYRKKPEFGLGSPPAQKDRYFKKIYARIEDTELLALEENIVLTLDYLISIDKGYLNKTLKLNDYQTFFKSGINNLYRMNMIDKDGVLNYSNLRPNRFKIEPYSNW